MLILQELQEITGDRAMPAMTIFNTFYSAVVRDWKCEVGVIDKGGLARLVQPSLLLVGQ